MRVWSVILAALVLSSEAAARDVNPEGIPVGHRAIGLGGAYTAVAGDGVALWYNPAGLGRVKSQGISANLTLYQWYRQEMDPFVTFDGKNESKLKSSDFGSIPSSLVYSLPLGRAKDAGEGHTLAAGIFVPDVDQYSAGGGLTFQNSSIAVIYKFREVRDEKTYWPGLGYGYHEGKWGFGGGLFIPAHSISVQLIDSIFIKQGSQESNGVSTVEFKGWDIHAVAMAGAVYELHERLTLGLSVRSPGLARLYASGDSLVIQGQNKAQDSYIDRFETEKIEFDQRIPLKVSAGAVWQATPELLLSLDLRFTKGIPLYTFIDSPRLPPTGADGRTLDLPQDELNARTADLSLEQKRKAVVNGAIGVEYRLSKSFMGRLGFYTDFSTLGELEPVPQTDFRVDIYSGVIGLGWIGQNGSTDLGVLVRSGEGEGLGVVSGGTADVSIRQVAIFLGGSADL